MRPRPFPAPIQDRRGQPGERGLAMIILLSTVMFVTVISMSLIGLMYTDITHASIQYALVRSYYIAQAGLAQAKVKVSGAADPAAYATPPSGVTIPFGGGEFTYWVDAGPATGCGPGIKTLEAVGQIAYRGRTFPRRVRVCAAPGAPFLTALFGVSRVQFQGANSRTYLAPYLTGTPGGGGSVGSFTEINFSDNDVRVNALSEESSETLTLRDGTFFDYALFGFSGRPDYNPTPTADPAPWVLSVFGDLVKAQPANRPVPTPCGSPYACVTVGNTITDVQRVADLREARYLRHVYVKSLRKEIVPPLDLDPEVFRVLAAQNTANAVLNSTAGLPAKRDSAYTNREFARILFSLWRHPSQSLQGTIFVDGPLQMLRRVSLGGTAGNVTLVVRGDLILRSTASVTNRHDLSTVAGRQTPGIVVFGVGDPAFRARNVCGVEVNGSGRLVVCAGGTLVADGLIYTQDGMSVGPKAFVDQVGAMYHNNRGTSHPSFVNDNATVVLRFDPLAISAFGTGASILSWQQLQGPGQAGAAAASPPTIALSPPPSTSATTPVAPAPPIAAVPPPAVPAPPVASAPPSTMPGPASALSEAAPRNPAHESAHPTSEPRSALPPVAALGGTAEAAHPASASAAPEGGPKFHVQAGAFRTRAYAEDLVQRLQAHGYTVTLTEGLLIRVRVGNSMSRGAGERLATELRSKGFDAIIRPAP
jgi:hypothetical protein